MGNVARRFGGALLVLGLGGWGAGANAQTAPGTPSLAGLWRYNAEKSDHPKEGEESGEGRYRGGRGGFPGGPEGGRNGPRMGGGRAQPAPDLTILSGLLRPVLQVLIRETDSTVAISDATGQLTTFYPDGRKIKEPQLAGDDVEISAKWHEGRLVVERKFPSVGSLKETWSLDPLSHALVLEQKLSGSRLPRNLEFRRVYDRSSEGTP